MRYHLFVITLLGAIFLAACGNGTSEPVAESTALTDDTTAEAATSEPTEMPEEEDVPTEAPIEEPATEPTEEPTAEPVAEARTFQIVPEETEASYDVQEQFLEQDLPVRAIGVTNVVEGEFQFTTGDELSGEVSRMTVDLRTLTSDSERRDGAIRDRWLESNTYPFAEFVSTEVQNMPESYTEGEEVTFTLVGDLTIREVTQPVTFDVRGVLEGDRVTGTATTFILMEDFGFEPPAIAGVLTVEDGVDIAVNFTAVEVSDTQE
ncbi:MAG: YceI family protein [Chloroflexota bacterium]